MRTHVGVDGATEMLRQFGIVGTRGRGPWVQGNNIDFVFFSPELKPLTHDGLKEVTPRPTEESQNSIRWVYTVLGDLRRERCAPVAIEAMKTILKRYPPRDTKAIRIPWQMNANAALYYSSYDDRRIVVVPTDKGEVHPSLMKSLGAPDVLHRHVHNYVFLKMDSEAPPEMRQAMKQAGPEGLVIVERPEERIRDGSRWQSTRVLATSPGPHTPAGVMQLLDKHVRAPGWEANLPDAK